MADTFYKSRNAWSADRNLDHEGARMCFYNIDNICSLRQSFTCCTLSILSGFAIWGVDSAGQISRHAVVPHIKRVGITYSIILIVKEKIWQNMKSG